MFAPLAYDAAMLLCLAIAQTEDAGVEYGTEEYRQSIIDALSAMDAVEGITGSYTFDELNNPIKSAAIIEVKGGQEVYNVMY